MVVCVEVSDGVVCYGWCEWCGVWVCGCGVVVFEEWLVFVLITFAARVLLIVIFVGVKFLFVGLGVVKFGDLFGVGCYFGFFVVVVM